MKFDGTAWNALGTTGYTSMYLFSSIALDNFGTPFVVFADDNADHKATVIKYNGTSWETVGTAGFSAGAIFGYNYSIAIDKNNSIYVSYADSGVNNKATVMKYAGENGVSNITNTSEHLLVYPNPNKGAFNVSMAAKDCVSFKATIIDMLGRVVKELVLPTNRTIGLQPCIPPGTYCFHAMANNIRLEQKIVIQ